MSKPLAPQHPVGPPPEVVNDSPEVRKQLIDSIQQLPGLLSRTVSGLNEVQLDTLYRNWTIRQIVHHIADSHLHSYLRFKWALTEENPTIKPYEEADWVQLEDARAGAVEPSVQLLSGLHARWSRLLRSMTTEQYARTFFHPQSGKSTDLWTALHYYEWHGRHHASQIEWLRQEHGW